MPHQIIDLTHSIHADMPTYPGDLMPEIKPIAFIEKQHYRETGIHMSTHTGTHIDAPSHVIPDGSTLDSFPIDTFIGKGCVIDCFQKNTITIDNLKPAFASDCPEFVLIYTGWDSLWGTGSYYTNIPRIEAEAVRFLARQPLKGIGIDGPSFDPTGSESLPVHKTLLSNNILLIENLTGLNALAGKQFIFYCLPLNIKNTEGSPVRAIAIIQD